MSVQVLVFRYTRVLALATRKYSHFATREYSLSLHPTARIFYTSIARNPIDRRQLRKRACARALRHTAGQAACGLVRQGHVIAVGERDRDVAPQRGVAAAGE